MPRRGGRLHPRANEERRTVEEPSAQKHGNDIKTFAKTLVAFVEGDKAFLAVQDFIDGLREGKTSCDDLDLDSD